ncbi:MAG: MMPL family transporter [Ilumatobacteraceae bacterium]|nr:MMPL family transporter [Ilumatobacteraceae bacterium]
MESFWRATGINLGKYWKAVAAAVVAVTAILAIGLTQVEFATGQDSYLNPESQIALDNVEFQENFGGETVILLMSANEDGVDVADLVGPANLSALEQLTAELEAVDNVFSVITPPVSLTFSDELIKGPGRAALIAAAGRDADGGEARGADIQVGLARLAEVDDQTLGNPAWNDVLIYGNDGFELTDGELTAPADDERAIRLSLAGTFPDAQTAVAGVVLDGNLDLDAQSLATEEVLDLLEGVDLEGFDLTVTGSPVYLKEINDYLKGGMLTLGAIALGVMALVLGLMFRVRWRLLPLLAVLIGVLWTFSILGLIGIDLSLVTISGLPILIGLGIDFAIQIHNRVEEEQVLDHDEHPIAETVSNLAPPLIVAAIAGIVAFLALQLSKVPMIRDFGVLLAIGVLVLVAVGIVVPASILGIREWTTPTDDRGDSLVERIVVKLGGLPTKAGIGLVLASVVLFVGGILVEGRTKIESDPVKWIDQGSEVVADIERLENETGFGTTLGVLVQANNVYDQDVIDLVHEFTIAAEARDDVVASSSLVNTMAKIITIPGATVIPPTEEEIAGAAGVMPEAIARALVNDGQTAAQVNLRLAPASLEERAVLVDELRDDLDARLADLQLDPDSILLTDLPADQEPVRVTPAGLATVGIGLLENLSANRAALTYLSLCLAGLWLVLRFRSLSRALLALVPVFLAVGASSLIVGLVGIQLSPLTTVSGPLVIASCTEFSVLIFGRYLEERQTGLASRLASDTAAARTGRAFFTSAATTIGGFAVLMISPLPLLRDFGLIVTLNVAIALMAALIVMPPIMVWVDDRGWLGIEPQVDPNRSVRLAAPVPGDQTVLAGVGAVAFIGAAAGVYASADTSQGDATTVEYASVALPTTTTTVAPTTTTTVPPTTVPPTTVEGEEPPPSTEAPATTEPSGPVIDPADFPDTVPAGVFAPALFGLLTDAGLPGNTANCVIATSFERGGGEETLVPLLLASDPTALETVRQAGADCGAPADQVDAAIAAGTGG